MDRLSQQPDENPSRQKVLQKIAQKDSWYVGSHFEWADQDGIRTLYDKRCRFFMDCIRSARGRLGEKLRLLDVGCGDGYWIKRLREESGLEVSGIDYNPLRIERAGRAVSPELVKCVNIFEFESAELFDVILLNQVIEHVQEDRMLLKKLRGLLRVGGVLILGTTNEGCFLQQWSLHRRGASFETDHVHFYTEDEVRKKICDAGFSADRVFREVFYPGNDRIYYGLMRRGWGFKLLEFLTLLFASQCSDYYFECRAI